MHEGGYAPGVESVSGSYRIGGDGGKGRLVREVAIAPRRCARSSLLDAARVASRLLWLSAGVIPVRFSQAAPSISSGQSAGVKDGLADPDR